MTNSNVGPDARDQWITRPEAAKYLGVKIGTLAVWECTKRYNVPCYKVGKSVRYKQSDLDAVFMLKGKKSKPKANNNKNTNNNLDNE